MTKSEVDLICDVAELAAVFEETSSLEDFLDRVVELIALHMKAAVCSIYLLDEDCKALVLRATRGLETEAVSYLQLSLGEGIVGAALAKLTTIREGRASDNPSFKAVPNISEELFEAILAVPILRGSTPVGVLVVQHGQPFYFDEHDAKALRAIAAQLATTLENAKLLFELRRRKPGPDLKVLERDQLGVLIGIPCAPGLALGEAVVIGRPPDSFAFETPREHLLLTTADLDKAVDTTEKQLELLQRQLEEEQADVASSFIFSAHVLMLKDEGFLGRMHSLINQGASPPDAVLKVINDYVQIFAASGDVRFQEKAQDVKDLGFRLLRNLVGTASEPKDYRGRIIVAADPLPSDILRFAAQRAEGIVFLGGHPSSHVSILARSLNLPMIIVNDDRMLQLAERTPIFVDAQEGRVYIEPSERTRGEYQQRANTKSLDEGKETVLPTTSTQDGIRIHLLASINLLRELKTAHRFKAEGVGLYRTEFPFIIRNDSPPEEEQYLIYRAVVNEMTGKVITFRTLDVGGDKILEYYPSTREANPFLGLRAIRFALRNREIFTQQLRALLRSGAGAAIRIMFPFISSVDDFLQARELVEQAGEQLTREGVEHSVKPRIGAMIELPSAVEVIDELAEVADFLSIGSNDLVQYMLAVDRTNSQVSDLYLPHHPAVLRALKKVADAGANHGIDVSMCGQMGAAPRMLPFLIGIGIRNLSLNPQAIPQVQAQVGHIDAGNACNLAKELVSLGRISQVEELLGEQSE